VASTTGGAAGFPANLRQGLPQRRDFLSDQRPGERSQIACCPTPTAPALAFDNHAFESFGHLALSCWVMDGKAVTPSHVMKMLSDLPLAAVTSFFPVTAASAENGRFLSVVTL
jgi:hypothetical protein